MSTLQYTPPPTVRDFIRHFSPGELFMDWIVGPVGSGKTTGIFFKLAYMAGLQAKSPIDGVRRSRAVVVRNTMPQLKDTTIKSWSYWFKDGQAGKWALTDKTFTLKFGDVECEVMFRALDTADDVEKVLSLEVTFAVLDEFVQIPKEIVEGLSARCGRYPPEIHGGATNWGLWGASNPGNENNWWFAPLEDPEVLPQNERPTNWKYFKQPSGLSDKAENIMMLPGKMAYYLNLIKGKTEHWIKQYVEVEWGYSLDGKPVFPEFRKEYHVAKYSLTPNPHLPIVAGYDPGMSSALVFGQLDMWGRMHVLDEIVMEGVGTQRMIPEHLKPLLANKYKGFEFIIVPDPASNGRGQANEKSVLKILKEAGLAIDYQTNNVLATRLEAAQYYMMRRTGQGEALVIDPGCKNLIRALVGGYKYTLKKGEVHETPDKNKHSHVADAFCYLARHFKSGIEIAGKKVGRPAPPTPKYRNLYNQK